MNNSRNIADSVKTPQNPLVKFALEIAPLVMFLLANSQGHRITPGIPFFSELSEPIYFATAVFMAAIGISLAASLILTKSLPVMPLITAAFVLVFGTLTLWLQDDTFIKIKPTLINLLFGSILLIGLLFNRVLLKLFFDSAFNLNDDGWYKLTIRWGLYFYFLALLNEFIWRNFSTDFWVQFKVFGIMPLTIAFTLLQMPLIMKHARNREV